MKGTKFRIALAAFAALAVISATAGVASAAPGFPGPRAPGLKAKAQTAQAGRAGTSLPVVKGGYVVAGVSAHSTGDGPYDEEDCNNMADLINTYINAGIEFHGEGSKDAEAWAVGKARDAVDAAENRGCFIIY